MRKLVRTYPIFNITDRLMNIHCRNKVLPSTTILCRPAVKSSSRVSTPEIDDPPKFGHIRPFSFVVRRLNRSPGLIHLDIDIKLATLTMDMKGCVSIQHGQRH